MGWQSVAAPRSPAEDRSELGPELFPSALGLVGAGRVLAGRFIAIPGVTGSSRLGLLKESTLGAQVVHAARLRAWSSPLPRLVRERGLCRGSLDVRKVREKPREAEGLYATGTVVSCLRVRAQSVAYLV